MATTAEVLKPFDDFMAGLGFTKNFGKFAAQLAPAVFGLVSFNVGRKGLPMDCASVNPVVAVSYAKVEETVARLSGQEDRLNATISRPLSALLPKSRACDWIVTLGDPASYSAIAELVHEYGLPYFADHTTLEQALSAARARQGHGLEFRIPVIEYILGDVEEARAEVAKLVGTQDGQENPYADYVRRFAREFEESLP